MNAGDVDKALEEYGEAQKMFPDNVEMTYWTAVSLANSDRLDEALPLFKEVFNSDQNWVTLTKRITENGILSVPDKALDKILIVHEK